MTQIRYANLNDANALGEIQSLAWRAAYKGIVPDDVLEAYTPEVRGKAFEGFLTAGTSLNAIALIDGIPAGWTCFEKCRDEDAPPARGEVWGIYVRPEYWRHGIGSQLLNWTIAELKAKGYTSVSLWVLEDNISARAFYERHMFKDDGKRMQHEIGRPLTLCRYARHI